MQNMNLRIHAANRVLERGISLEAVKMISDQGETLQRAKEVISPIANGKILKFRFQGNLFTATKDTISMVMKVGGDSFVIGMNGTNNHPVIVTAWSNHLN